MNNIIGIFENLYQRNITILPKTFYLQDTFNIAEDLLGKLIVHYEGHNTTAGRIVEVEIYIGKCDKASHAYRFGKTKRTMVMFERGGLAYVFNVHKYNQFCVVTGEKDHPDAILIRAIEPVYGVEIMKNRRKTENLIKLGSGPGILCQSLNITKKLYGIDLASPNSELFICDDYFIFKKDEIIKTKRIGINYAQEYIHVPWRYYLKNSPFVSVL
ncbi:MAG: DNA-3-methyladenine glycosylase [Candidatus Dojkabacteria bacterium]|nr:DNA-3-methyladenine glycosylase [Candidatus Dojkabacteria bacterium]